GESSPVTTVLPRSAEQPWNAIVIGGPTCVAGDDWYNVDRKAAGDPSGGTGWVKRSQAEYQYPGSAACVDTTSPTSSESTSGTLGNRGWYRSAVTVLLTASDTGCAGLDHTEYSI